MGRNTRNIGSVRSFIANLTARAVPWPLSENSSSSPFIITSGVCVIEEADLPGHTLVDLALEEAALSKSPWLSPWSMLAYVELESLLLHSRVAGEEVSSRFVEFHCCL